MWLSPRRAMGVRYVLAALIVFLASLILLATQPIWLAPPAQAITLVIYAILTLTWIPILDRGLRRLFKSRILFAVLAVLLVPVQCGACLLFSRGELPVKMVALYLSPLGKLDCQSDFRRKTKLQSRRRTDNGSNKCLAVFLVGLSLLGCALRLDSETRTGDDGGCARMHRS